MIEVKNHQTLRRAADRGYADHGWLKSYHSFSFAEYFDARHVQFGPLRVINEDRIAPGTGFGMHAHRDMEIISYVLEGELAHKDSMGNGSVIRPGDVQRMSAGTGVLHSEYNHANQQETHFLQIWIMPDRSGAAPGYEQKHFDASEKRGKFRIIASGDGRLSSVRINQDASLWAGLFDGAEHATLAVSESRKLYAHVARGSVTINEEPLAAGDALMLNGPGELRVQGGMAAEVLVFDLPA